jgi:di/tricarboxylate transporter
MSHRLTLPLLVALGAALTVLHFQSPGFHVIAAALVVLFAIASWTFRLVPEPLTTLLFFFFVVVFKIAAPEVALSGFTSSAWWLLFGGSITAIAVETTGLGKRLAVLLFRHWTRYSHAVAAVAVAALALAFVMPSTLGRILFLMPIVIAFAESRGLERGQAGWTGIIFTAAAVTYMPSTAILPANIPNSILMGAADTLYGVKLTYGPYLLLHFPILGALKTAILVWLVCRMYPEHSPLADPAEHQLGPMSPEEKRLSLLLGGSLILYATDSLHGVSPAWISLATGILCVLPPVGVLTTKTMAQRLNLFSLLYIAGILGLGAVVGDSGLGAVVSGKLLEIANLTPGNTLTNVAALSAINYVITMLTGVTGVPAVLTPLAGHFAEATGLPILTVLMLEVIAFSMVLLPYMSPPTMIGLQMGGVSIAAATRLCLALGAITVLVLLPLDYVWWSLLGYLP